MKQIVKSYLLNKTRKEQGKGKKEHRWKLDYQMKDTLIPIPLLLLIQSITTIIITIPIISIMPII